MKIQWKDCFRLGTTVFLTFLAIHYWEKLTKLAGVLFGAASALILGCVIAYVLNILMSFYEKHYFPASRKEWVEKSRRIVCMLAAILTLVALIGLIFAIYLLIGKESLISQFSRLMEHYLKPSWNEKVRYVAGIFNDSFHRFIVGQCIEAVVLGLLCILGMSIIRLPYAMMIGTLIGFTALIPVAGAYIGAGVGAFMILTVSPVQALIFLIFIVILQQLEGNLIYPKVVGSSIGLPGVWVLAAVTIGGGVMGISGMLLGVPTAAALYRLLRNDLNK